MTQAMQVRRGPIIPPAVVIFVAPSLALSRMLVSHAHALDERAKQQRKRDDGTDRSRRVRIQIG